jgi:hypothetical protein
MNELPSGYEGRLTADSAVAIWPARYNFTRVFKIVLIRTI